jgi:dolichyl-phosphate-mannose-protein mannosyltransferase
VETTAEQSVDVAVPETSDSEREMREHRLFLAVALVLLATVLWLMPLGSSLWLDETATYWVVQGDLHQMVHRALQFQSGSVPYFFVAWLSRLVGGTSEVVLRLPSVVFMGIATFLVYRLGKRLIDTETGILGAFVFVSMGGVAFAAADARPYALAVMLLVASTLLLVRWLEGGRPWDAVGHAVLGALTIYTHYLFALGVLALVPYALKQRSAQGRPSARSVVLVYVGMGLLLLPAGAHFISLWERRGVLSVPADNSLQRLAYVLAPPLIVVGVLLGLLVARLLVHVRASMVRAHPRTLLLLSVWMGFPIVTLFAISHLSSTELLATRYFLMSLPPLALLTGWGIRMLGPARARRMIVLVLLALSLFSFARIQHGLWFEGGSFEDWRGAAAAERGLVRNSSTPVLVQADFIESSNVNWFRNTEKRSYLLAPLSIYPMNGRILPLPYGLVSPSEGSYLTRLTNTVLSHTDHFFLVTRYLFSPYRIWLEGRLGPDFRSHLVGTYGSNAIVRFDREKPP